MQRLNSAGAVTEKIVDAAGRVEKEYILGENSDKILVEENLYSVLDTLCETTDGNGNTTKTTLDTWGRILSIKKPDNSFESYTYDHAGNIESTTDGNGGKTQYIYNSFNKLKEIIDQSGDTEEILYDTAFRAVCTTDRNDVSIRTLYNMDDQPVYRFAVGKKSERLQPESWSYNPDGTVAVNIVDGLRHSYAYDLLGRRIEEKQNDKVVLKYAYNKNSELIKQWDISDKETEFNRRADGRLKQVQDNNEEVATYSYTAYGKIEKIIYGNGVTTIYAYDHKKQLISQETKTKEGNILLSGTYKYDTNGNQIYKEEDGHQTTYKYDNLNRLSEVVYFVGEETERKELFSYDKAGNRTERFIDNLQERYYYDNRNRLVRKELDEEETNYVYDKQGNLISETKNSGVSAFNYDAYNRLSELQTEENSKITFSYDGNGLRREKTVDGKAKRYIYSRGQITAKLDLEDNILSREVRGYQPLKKEDSGKEYFYLQDGQHNTALLTDTKGEIACSYEYDAFGNLLTETADHENNTLYQGQYFDRETELYYLRARYYSPKVGRFIQEDVFRNDGLNLYAYVHNNPILWFDPSGYSCQDNDGVEDSKKVTESMDVGNISPELRELQVNLEELAEEHLLPKYREIDPDLEAGYTGSFKTGRVGNPNKETYGQEMDLDDFDIDYYIKSDRLFEEKGGKRPKAEEGFRKILSETPGFGGLRSNKKGFSILFKLKD